MARSTIALPMAVLKNLPYFTFGIFRCQAVYHFPGSQGSHFYPLFLFGTNIGSFPIYFHPCLKNRFIGLKISAISKAPLVVPKPVIRLPFLLSSSVYEQPSLHFFPGLHLL